MSEPTGRGFKTLAVRLPDELHSQLVLVAGLEEGSLTDTIRQAISELIERTRSGGDLAARATSALEKMEQEAQARRQALQALLGSGGPEEGQPTLDAPDSLADKAASSTTRPRRRTS
jgi:hypothetical protein